MRKAMYTEWFGGSEEAVHAAREVALAAGPNNPFVLSMMSMYAESDGDNDLAISFQRRAVAADPLHPGNLTGLTKLLIRQGDLEEAEKYALKAVEVAPESPVSNQGLADVRLFQGRGEEAVELAQKLPFDFTEWTSGIPGLLISALGFHTMGDQIRADAALEEFKGRAGEQIPIDVAMIHAWRGEYDEAFKWIEIAMEEKQDRIEHHMKTIYWHKLHGDPRWAEVMARLDE